MTETVYVEPTFIPPKERSEVARQMVRQGQLGSEDIRCPHCLSHNIEFNRRISNTIQRRLERYQCLDCENSLALIYSLTGYSIAERGYEYKDQDPVGIRDSVIELFAAMSRRKIRDLDGAVDALKKLAYSCGITVEELGALVNDPETTQVGTTHDLDFYGART